MNLVRFASQAKTKQNKEGNVKKSGGRRMKVLLKTFRKSKNKERKPTCLSPEEAVRIMRARYNAKKTKNLKRRG
jgi:hypothetical protein